MIEEANLPKLHTLELRGNRFRVVMPPVDEQLTDYEAERVQTYLKKMGFFHPGLRLLMLPENRVKTLAAVYVHPQELPKGENVTLKLNPFGSRLGMLPNLVALHLRGNGLKSLQGFTSEALPSIKYLNLR